MGVKRGRCTVAILLILTLVTAGVWANVKDRIRFSDSFETGKVQIAIENVEAYAGKLGTIHANQRIEYAPQIRNYGADCYVRVWIETGASEGQMEQAPWYQMNENWTQKGQYYYYKEPLQENEVVGVFDEICIPSEWDAVDAGDLRVTVRADAVQMKNFTPDFDLSLPWGAAILNEITSSIRVSEPVPQSSSVEFTGEGTFECVASELMGGLSKMMPGDRYEKIVRLKNTANAPLRAALNVATAGENLGEKMKMQILYNEESVFEGTVREAKALKGIRLGEIQKDGSGALQLIVSLPEETSNLYANKADDIVWEVQVETMDDQTGASPENVIRTGDMSDLSPYVYILIAAMICMIILVVYRRKGTK